MYLLFPTPKTLQFAVSQRMIPVGIACAAAEFAAGEDGRIWVKPSAVVDQSVLKSLKPLGVVTRKSTRGAGASSQAVSCWPQILPLERTSLDLSERTPVLFAFPESADVSQFITEMLRLGNDRQGLCQWESPQGTRTMLLVKGPPYYTLLRVLDGLDGPLAPKAYVERSPRVWVELGHRHPLESDIQPAEGTMLLIDRPRVWSSIPEGRFDDVYESLKLNMAEPMDWQPLSLDEPISVPLRLMPASAEESAEFWVLGERGILQLEALVQSSDDQLVSRLAFAVGMSSNQTGERTVVVKVRPSKEPPPVLVFDGLACRSYLRLPNLFVPVGRRIHPPLRRDAIKDLLAGDLNQNIWLVPKDDGGFVPQSLPENAFRPLSDWVAYIVDSAGDQLKAWSQSMQFDFEEFISIDEPVREETSSAKRQAAPTAQREADNERVSVEAPNSPKSPPKKAKPQAPQANAEKTTASASPSEQELKLRSLEQEFLDMAEPWDAPRRKVLWRELGAANISLGNHADGGLCYLSGIWIEPTPPADWIMEWFRSVADRDVAPLKGKTFEEALESERPSPGQLERIAIHLIAAAFGDAETPAVPQEKLEQAQHRLKQHEIYLPLKLTWLAWLALSRLMQGDELMLARARDRVLERLYDFGPNPNLDLPGFLRSQGAESGERLRAVKDAALQIREPAQAWIERELDQGNNPQVGQTAAYADLMIAYGYASVGLHGEGEQLLSETEKHLSQPAIANPVHDWFQKAFRFRIEQAFENQPRSASLPEELSRPLVEGSLDSGTVFIIDSLRSKSRILEPFEQIGSHTRQMASRTKGELDLDAKLEQLADIENPGDLAAAAWDLMERHGPTQTIESFHRDLNHQVLLAGLLRLAVRLGDTQTLKLLSLVPEAIAELDSASQKAGLLGAAIFAAAHFGHPALVRRFVEQLHDLMDSAAGPETSEPFGQLLGQSFRGLRKLGMRGEVAALLEHVEKLDREQKFDTESTTTARPKPAVKAVTSKADQQIARRAQSMTLRLNLAAGWFYFENKERGEQIIDEASKFLYDEPNLTPLLRRRLARQYAAVLELAPTALATSRLLEIFAHLTKITKGHGAGIQDQYYSYELLEIVDSVVLALVSEEMTLDRESRRRLDELEYAIRRRIHRDLEQLHGNV